MRLASPAVPPLYPPLSSPALMAAKLPPPFFRKKPGPILISALVLSDRLGSKQAVPWAPLPSCCQPGITVKKPSLFFKPPPPLPPHTHTHTHTHTSHTHTSFTLSHTPSYSLSLSLSLPLCLSGWLASQAWLHPLPELLGQSVIYSSWRVSLSALTCVHSVYLSRRQ